MPDAGDTLSRNKAQEIQELKLEKFAFGASITNDN